MNILFVWSDQTSEYNCSWYRAHSPLLALRRAGYTAESLYVEDWQKDEPEAHAITEAADLIMFQRNAFLENLQALLYWKSRGKTICIDLDDGYQQMTEASGSMSYNLWHNGILELDELDKDGKKKRVELRPIPLRQLEWAVKFCGKVSSPSRIICADWEDRADTYYLPNFLDMNLYMRTPVYREPGVIYIGWGGSMGHTQGWRGSGLPLALKQIVYKYKQVRVLFFGDDRVARLKDNAVRLLDIPEARKVMVGWTPYAMWPQRLQLLDIGLVPLDGEYDRRRSCLKSLEYTALGIPWIGTDAEPNRELLTGTLVDNTHTAWYKALEDYILSLEDRKRQAELNIEIAYRWDIDVNVPVLMKTYEDILNGGN